MQNIKDSFYEALRARLVAAHPERTIVLRGVTRPGVLVEENELVTAQPLPDCFRLRWVETRVDAGHALPVVTLTCAIGYETAGTAANAGMDRGRLLAAMDAELCAAVNTLPRNAPLQDFAPLAQGKPALATGTKVWWSERALEAVSGGKQGEGRLSRTATVSVMGVETGGNQ